MYQALGSATEDVKRSRDVEEIQADLLEEETLAKVWPSEKWKECILRGRNFIMTRIPAVRNLGTIQRSRKGTQKGNCELREKPISPFLSCCF